MEEFEAEKEKFRKEHPEKAGQGPDPSKLYEDTMERELRLIYEGQNTIHRVVAQLDAKLNQIIQSQQQIAGEFDFNSIFFLFLFALFKVINFFNAENEPWELKN